MVIRSLICNFAGDFDEFGVLGLCLAENIPMESDPDNTGVEK